MSDTSKRMSDRDYQQTLKMSYNDINATLGVDGFIVGQVGRKITRTDHSPTEEDYSFYDSATLLYTLRITYTDSSRGTLVQVERIA